MQMEEHEGRRQIHNRLLLAMPAASFKRLEPHLEWVDLEPGAWRQGAAAALRRVHFINRAFVSTVKTMQDGRSVEVGSNGQTDMVGLLGLYGQDHTAWEFVVQIPGSALRLSTDVLRTELGNDPQLRQLFDRYTYHMLASLAQTAACHRLHGLRQRFCRWLLMAQDATGRASVPMTHEILALMLGVQRSGVSLIVSAFHKAGILRTGRGSLSIIDRASLEAESCECYRSATSAQARIFEGLDH